MFMLLISILRRKKAKSTLLNLKSIVVKEAEEEGIGNLAKPLDMEKANGREGLVRYSEY